MKQCNAAPVLRLIYYRGVHNVCDEWMLRHLNEAADDDPDGLAVVLHRILDVFAAAARRLCAPTELGPMLRYAKLFELASVAPNTDHRTAAGLVLGHAVVYGTDIGELRDFGAEMFNAQIDYVETYDRAAPTVLAVIDVWLKLLPELTCDAGWYWLSNAVDTIGD